ncbi:MAG: hypothetical protein KDA61_19435, partial [Planctomycetales bacterium]|nr:hypothetical protein [Planctomycetales bacterium]
AGVVRAAQGATFDYGSNVVGYGVIDTPADSEFPLVVNGNIRGNSLTEPVTLTGYVQGAGTLDNCLILGVDAPGMSSASVRRGSVEYAGTLEIEIGGTLAGVGYDQVSHTLADGIASLGGRLDVILTGGYSPSLGDEFRILNAKTREGEFSEVVLPDLTAALQWNIAYDPSGVSLRVAATGDFDADGDVDGADFLTWQRGQSSTPGSWDDFLAWEASFGYFASSEQLLTSVPEPSTFAGAALLLVLQGFCCRCAGTRFSTSKPL